jgi:hypothetical protein
MAQLKVDGGVDLCCLRLLSCFACDVNGQIIALLYWLTEESLVALLSERTKNRREAGVQASSCIQTESWFGTTIERHHYR